MGRRARKQPEAPADPRAEVERILADERVTWFPVKHYSPACAAHVGRLIRALRPAAVLVEGPDDATEKIPFIVDPATEPPITVLSTHVDTKDEFGGNGVLSPSKDVPARYRGWWPLVPYAPEYEALRAGAEVGAELAFVDAPLRATIPFTHVGRGRSQDAVNDRQLAENAYFEALRRRMRMRSFEEVWQSTFEVTGLRSSTEDFCRAVLTFAWCTRNVRDEAALEADGTLLRERHMRWHVDRACKAHPDGRIVVVTGAFHSVALPHTRGKRAKARADRNTTTMVCQHSYPALARLYELNRLPGYGDAVWEAVRAEEGRPFEAAAMRLLLEVMRAARLRGAVLSTADAIEAYTGARNLSALRGHGEPTLQDVLDAAQMTYVKGERTLAGVEVEAASRAVLVGTRVGRVTPEAGQVPLLADFYQQAKKNRLDTSGARKTVRCDLGKQEKHRFKSAFLHRCAFLGLPFFDELDEDRGWRTASAFYKGPNLVTGEDLHLITETWAIRWTEEIDDRLLELSDRGTSLARAAERTLLDQVEQELGDAAACSKLLLRCAQMLLLDAFPKVLEAVEAAVAVDASFDHLVHALSDFVVLYGYREELATRGHAGLAATLLDLHARACLRLPTLRAVDDDQVRATLERLQTLVRITLTLELPGGEVPDRQRLVEALREMVADPDGQPAVRGAGYGVLYSLGATRERVVARELDSYLLGAPERVLQAGAFLDGLFGTARSVFLGSPRLLQAVHRVLGRLEWDTFKRLLPDLRRAFTAFIPAELDRISERVAQELALEEAPATDAPVPEAVVRVVRRADARVREVLAGEG